MKDLFCQSILLYHLVRDRPYVLLTDACKLALGACLLQYNEDYELQLVCLASRTIKDIIEYIIE